MSQSKTVMLGTDVAHLMLFHPADLAHAADWPIAWYAEPFVYPAESAAGRLLAWRTRSDGGFKLRLGLGPLTEREAAYAGAAWRFPFTVRHGAVFVDNSDGLPGREQMHDPADHPDLWFELPNGAYAVTVTGIDWSAEPGAESFGDDTLPNYAVTFEPLGAEPAPAPARRPPDLISARGVAACDAPPKTPPRAARRPVAADLSQPLPAFAAADARPAPQAFRSQGEGELSDALPAGAGPFELFDRTFVAAPTLEPGRLAVLVECRGARAAPGEPKRYDLTSLALVRLRAVSGVYRDGEIRPEDPPPGARAVRAVRVDPVETPSGPPIAQALEAVRTRIVAAVERDGPLRAALGGEAGYQALYLRAASDPLTLADWLLAHAPLDAAERLEIAALGDRDRLERLLAAIDPA